MSKLGLGKGLSSLLGSDEGSVFGEDMKETTAIELAKIEINPSQPRSDFNEQALEELSQSIIEHGVISPIIVRKIDQKYQIIAGERRFRASKLAGLKEIPARIIEATDKQVAEIALIENLQREDLNPLEEALGYKELMKKFHMTQEEISKSVGKSRSAIANTTRILVLDDKILLMIKSGLISLGHARAILSVEDNSKHLEFANYITENELNVRQSEKQAKILNFGEIYQDPDEAACIAEFENRVQDSLCRKVKIVQNKNRKKGKVVLEYFNNEDLENLMEILSSMKM
ncbi:MAG: ParB/RepB/Spo0J family partition protein [Clostridia bacterium]